MEFDVESLLAELAAQLQTATDMRGLYVARNIFVKQKIKPLYAALKAAPLAAKRSFGQELQALQAQIDAAVNKALAALETKRDETLTTFQDITLPARNLMPGTNHVFALTVDHLLNFFHRFGFKVYLASELTDVAHCFDYLNVPPQHPGRSRHDTFYTHQAPNMLLRSQCTASTVEGAIAHKKSSDIRIVSFGNVYRNDTDDATHSHQFFQLDFMWLKEGMCLANLKWFIEALLHHVFARDVKIRFRLSHFPFTEPSFEVDVACWNCHNGCSLCKQSRWIEILGSGVLHQRVLDAIGADKKLRGIAAGIGIDRLVMLRYGIADIRDLYTNDFRFTTQFKGHL